jgi:hypothetical protein
MISFLRVLLDTKKILFELLPDDERQYNYCRTTCFVASAVSCACKPSKKNSSFFLFVKKVI